MADIRPLPQQDVVDPSSLAPEADQLYQEARKQVEKEAKRAKRRAA
jgi:hypothetical protein